MLVGKVDFITLITKAREEALKPSLIKVAWKYAGIEPFRSMKVLRSLPKWETWIAEGENRPEVAKIAKLSSLRTTRTRTYVQTPQKEEELMAYAKDVENFIPTPVMGEWKKIVKVAATAHATTPILKAEKASLRRYEFRREPCVGPKTIITKARVVNGVELEEKKDAAKKRAAKAELAKQRKRAKMELEARRVSIITHGEEITDDED